MTVLLIVLVLLFGQGLMVLTLFRIIRTLGVYTQRLTETHQQNLEMRYNLASIENEIAVRQMLQKKPPPGKERVS